MKLGQNHKQQIDCWIRDKAMGLQGKRAAEHRVLERLILVRWEAAWVLEEREVMSQADQ